MTVLQTIGCFLKGAYTKFGTSANLVREVSVSVLTAVAVAVLVQMLTPAGPDVVTEFKAVLERQHQADSIRFTQQLILSQKTTGGCSCTNSHGISAKRR